MSGEIITPAPAYFEQGKADRPPREPTLPGEGAPVIILPAVHFENGKRRRRGDRPAAPIVAIEAGDVADFAAARITRRLCARLSTAETYLAYATWCGRRGRVPLSANAFARAMGDLGFKLIRSRQHFWDGVVLRPAIEAVE